MKKNAALMLVSLAFSLLLGEALLSAIHYPKKADRIERGDRIKEEGLSNFERATWWVYDDTSDYMRFEPSKVKDCPDYEKVLSGRLKVINRQGFHDTDEFQYSDSLQNKFRVLALGDSFTFGMSADIGKSWVDFLESNLSQRIDTVVWNAGIPATGTKQALSVLKKFGPIMNPDLIIYGFFVNDFRDNLYPVDMYYITNSGKAIMRYEIDKNFNTHQISYEDAVWRAYNIRLDSNAFEKLFYNTRLYSLLVDAYGKAFGRKWIDGDEFTVLEQEMKVTQHLLYGLREWSARNNSEFVVLLIPEREDLKQTRIHYAAAKEILDTLRIRYIDIRQDLSEKDYSEAPDPHWNNSGHIKAGEAVLRYITREVLSRNRIHKIQRHEMEQDINDTPSPNN